jgi:hypothetical protein
MSDFNWEKRGMIYEVQNDCSKLLTHASNPVALHLNDDVFRVFYSGRDQNNRSSVSYVDIDFDSFNIVDDNKNPIVCFGEEDSFYSHGITIGNIWNVGNDSFMGFMGWQHRSNQHWRGDIGKINLSTNEVSLVLGKNNVDKVSLSYPFVLKDGQTYKMWYGSTISWTSENDEMIHVINYAESKDSVNWELKGESIPWKIGVAQAFSRPTVLKIEGKYHMWYSYRSGDGTPYRIGYSSSTDGIKWTQSSSNIDVSADGWDSQMVCYPFVFRHKNKLFMLYNGNSYGKSGFGVAICNI